LAGTPENYRTNVAGGAKGNGGTNYTGTFTSVITPTVCKPTTSCGPSPARIASNIGEVVTGTDFTAKAYPNPFTNSTTIEFQRLDKSGRTIVEVYSLSGEKVATLFDNETEAGVLYTTEFKAENLPDGIYVYRVLSNEDIVNGKLILVR
jgi:hypothetical protein